MAALGVIFRAQRGNSTTLCRIVLFQCSIFDPAQWALILGSQSVCLSVCPGVMLEGTNFLVMIEVEIAANLFLGLIISVTKNLLLLCLLIHNDDLVGFRHLYLKCNLLHIKVFFW